MAEKDACARLRRAVKENNLFLVKRLIKRTDMRNPDPSVKRYTSLAWAAILGHEETFEFLLSSGHDDDHEYSKDSENNTILLLLADARPPPSDPHSKGPSEQDFLGATLRMARMYIDRYPEVLDWANIEGKTALHVAAQKGNEELVRMLCDHGADFDLADNEGNTPLHYASAWGNVTIVQLLIERGCQYSARNNQGFTPSDYAYSISTRDALQDTARIQFENNKKARRNVYQQAAVRGNEWNGPANMQVYPPSPREHAHLQNGSVRVRSGSGTSHTTTTSNSGDLLDGHVAQQAPSRFWSSPSRRPAPLPSGSHSPGHPGHPSASSTSSTFGFASSPVSQPNSATLLPNVNSNPASALSPIATRMRERDADAMEKYKLRQRSGSATTASTDSPSQNESASPPAPPPKDTDEVSALSSIGTIGSVAPRRRLRPSASAAQLRTNPQPLTIPTSQGEPRSRSGTSPAMLKPTHNLPSPPGESSALPTPTQNSTAPRPSIQRSGSSQPPVGGNGNGNDYTGPPSEYARFPPPPMTEEPERASTPTTATAPTHTRRLPFNLLSSHKNSMDSHVSSGGHRRNASVNAVVR
ncbi:ankyrin [Dichomitus squalens]|uniref:Ankyrin n=2 Tax=Dichomitus squalens TaxID=114155 RepID=A0A4Q9N157_9APHY|nr:ankyrin [Dichomitus squalens LYAD-421 SS1]EJF61159.1 ankyrin [Dichomitus squalens LYAD-421 SS1]TBU32862.1 ankyrin [Dichomitus squalens]TBU49411.1 ankyrin [Dichomitus squalens]TBU63989.1 ankyrin [Dichomitus squalens]